MCKSSSVLLETIKSQRVVKSLRLFVEGGRHKKSPSLHVARFLSPSDHFGSAVRQRDTAALKMLLAKLIS